MNKVKVEEFLQRMQKANPNPKGELDYTNEFTLLVAVVLSAQATDVGVNKATRALFKAADTPERMLALGLEGLKEYIKTIGLFNTKARNIIGLSQALIAEHGGRVPEDRAALEKFP
ncbi:MAG: endonuclease III, partial [Proteobacteria bacterium]|nr:endonuclease III [Pseudomonadota bacterium]